jgi:cytochrome c553
MNKPIRFLLISGALSTLAFFSAVFLLPGPQGPGLTVGEDIPFYFMPWNDNPFFPGELKTADGKLLNPENIPSAEFCAQCHETEYREWVSSIHSVSGPDLLYEIAIGNNEEAHKTRSGAEKIRWCEACHEPVNLLMGEVNPIPVVGPSPVTAEGTTCIICHTAADADPLAGNGALTLAINNLNHYDEASDTISYAFPVPQDAQGPLKVESTLWYRLALQEFVTYSLKLDLVLPPVLMEQARVEISVR